MRRSNKPSGYNHAVPPGHHSSHLDIPSSHDDEPSSKLHKSKHRYSSKAKIFLSALCSLVALGTLGYVAKMVNRNAVVFLKLTRGGKIAAIQNIKHKMKNHHKKDRDRDRDQSPSNERISSQENNLLPPDSIYRATVTDIYGTPQSLLQYAGSVSLVVNVACECGLTKSNYKQLAVLHDKYKQRGFVVLAFPSNDFHQEKETDREILDYVHQNFPEVSFPIFSKSPLASNVVFQMSGRHTGEMPEWNFHKYLLNGDGKAVKSFGHRVSPFELEDDIIKLLEENAVKGTKQVPQTA